MHFIQPHENNTSWKHLHTCFYLSLGMFILVCIRMGSRCTPAQARFNDISTHSRDLILVHLADMWSSVCIPWQTLRGASQSKSKVNEHSVIQAHSSFLVLMWFCCGSICGPADHQNYVSKLYWSCHVKDLLKNLSNFVKCMTSNTKKSCPLNTSEWERKKKKKMRKKKKDEDL